MADPKRRNISQKSEMVYDIQKFGLSLDTREIYLQSDADYHYDEAMIDFTCANTFIKNINMLNGMGTEPILIHMITDGGDWNYGMAIYDAIKSSPSEIILLAYAHARSMSSIIPQAADVRIIMPNADFLIHNGSMGFGECNYQSVVSEVEWAKKQATETMMNIYVERCLEGQFFKRDRMDAKQIRIWLEKEMAYKQEVYFTARQSVDMGFMDAVLGDEGYENISSLRE